MLDADSSQVGHDSTDDICILHNPHSGKKEAGVSSETLLETFDQHGLSPRIVDLDPSRDLGTSVENAVADGHKTIIAAGGDGTICGVAQALIGKPCRFGIIPRGTFNYFARSLDIPHDVPGAVEVIAQGRSRPLRVAMLNDRIFLNNANFGLYPQILRSREEIYDFWGRSRAAAYWSAIKVLFRWPKPLVVDIVSGDKTHTVKTPMVFVFNNAFQLRHMGMEGAECIEAGQLALLLTPDRGRLGLVMSSFAMLMGRATRRKDFHLLCSDRFEIRARSKKLLVARDGERSHMDGPFEIALCDSPLDLIVPANATDGTR